MGNPTDTSIMQNSEIIAINQDPLGVQGFRIQCEKVACPEEGSGCRCDRHVWMRELSGGRYALTAINFRPYGEPNSITFNLKKNTWIEIGEGKYSFSEVYGEGDDFSYDVSADLTVWVNVNSCLTWILTPVAGKESVPLVEIVEGKQPK